MLPPSGPGHNVRNVSMTTGVTPAISSAGKSTIGQSLAKVKDFMDKHGRKEIQALGKKISGDYDFKIFPKEVGKSFTIELDDLSCDVSLEPGDTQEIAEQVNRIWNSISGLCVSASSSAAALASSSRVPAASSLETEEPLASAASSARSMHAARSSLDSKDEISQQTLDNVSAVSLWKDRGLDLEGDPFYGHLVELLNRGFSIIKPSGGIAQLTDAQIDALERSDDTEFKDFQLDLFLLDDIIRCLNTDRYQDASVTITLLSDNAKERLLRTLNLDTTITLPVGIYSEDHDAAIKEIASILKEIIAPNKASLLIAIDRVKNGFSFEWSKKAQDLLLDKARAAHDVAAASLESEIAALSARSAALEEELELASAGLEEARREAAILDQRLADATALAGQKSEQLEAAARQIRHLEGHKQILEQALGRVIAKRDKYSALNHTLTARHKEALRGLGEANEALRKALELNASLALQNKALRKEKGSLQQQLQALSQEVDTQLRALGTTEELIAASPSLQDKLATLKLAYEKQIRLGNASAEASLGLCEEYLRRLAALEQANGRLSGQATDLAARLEHAKETERILRSTIADLTSAKDAALAEAKATKARAEEAEGTVLRLEGQIADQARTIGELTSRADAAERLAAQRFSEIGDLKTQMADATRVLQAQASDHEAALREAAARFNEVNGQFISLTAEHATLDRQHQKKLAELEEAAREIAHLKEQKGSVDQALAQLQPVAEQQARQIEQLEAEKGILDQRIAAALANVAAGDKQIGALSLQLVQAQALKRQDDVKIARLRAFNHAVFEEYQKIKALLTKSLFQKEEMRAAFFAASSQFESEASRLSLESKELKAALEIALAEIRKLQAQLSDEGRDKSLLQAELDAKIQEITRLNPQLLQAQASYQKASSDLQASQALVEELKGKISTLEAQNREIVAANESTILSMQADHAAKIRGLDEARDAQIAALTSSKDAIIQRQAQEIEALIAEKGKKEARIAALSSDLKAIASLLGIEGVESLDDLTALKGHLETAIGAFQQKTRALEEENPSLKANLAAKSLELEEARAAFDLEKALLTSQISALAAQDAEKAALLEQSSLTITRLGEELKKRQALLMLSVDHSRSLKAKLLEEKAKVLARDERIASLDQEAAQLRLQIATLKVDGEGLKGTLDQKLREKEALNATLQGMMDEASRKEVTLSDLRANISALQGQVSEKDGVLADLTARFKEQIAELKAEKDALRAATVEQIASVKRQTIEAFRQISEIANALEAKNKALNADLEAKALENLSQKQAIEALRPKALELSALQEALIPRGLSSENIASHLAAFDELSRKQEAFVRELTKFGDSPEAIKKAIETQDTALEALRTELRTASQAIVEKEGIISELQRELGSKDRALVAAQSLHRSEIAALTAQKDKALADLEDAKRGFIQGLAERDSAHARAIAAVQEMLNAKTEQAESLSRANSAHAHRIEELEAALRAKSEENALLKEQLRASKQETALEKLATLAEKKAKAFHVWRLNALAIKHASETSAFREQIAEQAATISTLKAISKDHDALVAFLKGKLQAGEELDPEKPVIDALMERFGARLAQQDEAVAALTTQLLASKAQVSAQTQQIAENEATMAGLEHGIASRRARIAELEAAVDTLGRDNSRLSSELEEAIRVKGQDDIEIARLRADISAQAATIRALTQDKGTASDQIIGLERDLAAAQKKARDNQEALRALQGAHDALSSKHQAQTQELASTKAAHEALKATHAELIQAHEKEIARIKEENETALHAISSKLELAERQLASRSTELDALREELASTQAAFGEERARLVREHEARLSELGRENTGAQDLLASRHAAEIARVQASHEAALATKQLDIDAAARALAELEGKHRDLTALQTKTSKALHAAEAANSLLSGEKTGLLEANGKLEAALHALNLELEAARTKLASQEAIASSALSALRSQNARLEGNIQGLLSALEMPSGEVARAIEKIQAQSRAIKALEVTLGAEQAALRALRDTSSQDALRHQAEIERLTAELAAQKQAIKETHIENQAALASLLEQFAQLEDDVPEVSTHLAAISEELARVDRPIIMADILKMFEPLADEIASKVDGLKFQFTMNLGSMKTALAAIKAEHEGVQHELEASKAAIAYLIDKMARAEELASSQLSEAMLRFQDLKELARGQDATIRKKIDEIARLTQENADASAAIRQLQDANAHLGDDVAAAARALIEVKAATASDIAAVQRELEAKELERAALQTTSNRQQAQILEQSGTIHRLEQDVIAARAHSADLTGQLEPLRKKLAENEAALSALRMSHSMLKAHASSDAEALAAATQKIATLEEETPKLQAAIANLTRDNEIVLAQKQSATSLLEELTASFGALQTKASADATALAAATSENTTLKARLAALTPQVADLERLRSTLEELAGRNRALEEEKAEIEAGGKAALEAQRLAQEQLRASLEMVRVLTEESLPKTEYGRFNSLYNNHLAALANALRDHRDLDRRITCALHKKHLADPTAASSGVSDACIAGLLITGMPFADDRRVMESGGTLAKVVCYRPDSPDPQFPSVGDARYGLEVTSKINLLKGSSGGTGKGSGALGGSGGLALCPEASAMYDASRDAIIATVKRSSGASGAKKVVLAGGGGGAESPEKVVAAFSVASSGAVNKELGAESAGGKTGVEHLFRVFKEKQEIKQLLFQGLTEAQITAVGPALHAESKKYKAALEELTLSYAPALKAAKNPVEQAAIRADLEERQRAMALTYQSRKAEIRDPAYAALKEIRKARKKALTEAYEAAHARYEETKAAQAHAQAEYEAVASPKSSGASTASASSKADEGKLTALLEAQKQHKLAFNDAVEIHDELSAIEGYDALIDAGVSEDIIFTALNQRFAKDAAYFDAGSPLQTHIDAIAKFITRKHINALLAIIINNGSLPIDLCAKRITIGTQMLGHAQQEKLELSGALKSAFTLLNQLYSSVILRL